MSDDIIQQAQQSAGIAGLGGIGGVTLAIITGLKLFARPQDLELLEAKLRAEFAERYVSKEMLQQIMEKLNYIQDRLDKLSERP